MDGPATPALPACYLALFAYDVAKQCLPVSAVVRASRPSASDNDSDVRVERGSVASPTVSGDTINGIPRVDPRARPAAWKRGMQRLAATRPGAAVHRMIAAPLDATIMKATGGRVVSRSACSPWSF